MLFTQYNQLLQFSNRKYLSKSHKLYLSKSVFGKSYVYMRKIFISGEPIAVTQSESSNISVSYSHTGNIVRGTLFEENNQ